MRARRLISLALAAVMALAVAGIAIAHGGGGQAQKTEQVQAAFTATPVADKTKSKTCTGVDGTYAITRSVDQGEATGDPRLSGKITIRSKSVVNTTTGLGWSEGNVQTRDATTGKVKGESRFTAVITEGSKLEGFIEGKVKNPPAPTTPKAKGDHGNHGKLTSELLANFSATVAQDGSTAGAVGDGDGANTAILHGNPCAPQPKQPAAEHQQGDQGEGHGHHHGGPKGDDDRK
jgi:hypothetical protein